MPEQPATEHPLATPDTPSPATGSANGSRAASAGAPAEPPRAARRTHLRSHHGRTFEDPYEWLRDVESPEVRAHLAAENAWFDRCTASHHQLRQDLVADIEARTQQTDLGVPTRVVHRDAAGGERAYWYYRRTVEGQSYPIFMRLATTDGPDALPPDLGTPGPVASGLPTAHLAADAEVVLDLNEEAEGHEFFSLGMLETSPDGTRLAWSVDTAGDERFTVRVRDLATGQDLPDRVEGMAWGGVWAGNDTLVLTRCDESWRPWQVIRHRLGEPGEPPVVLQEDDERFWLGVDTSRDERWVLVVSASKDTTQAWLAAADDPEVRLHPLARREPGVEYEVEVGPDRLWITHNATLGGEPAPDFAIATAPLPDPDATATEVAPPSTWTPVLRPAAGTRVMGVDAYRGHQVVAVRTDARLDAHVIGTGAWPTAPMAADHLPADSALSARLATAGHEHAATVATVMAANLPDVGATRVRATHTSLVDPPAVLELALDEQGNLSDAPAHLLRRTPVLDHPVHGPYRPQAYVQTRLWATAEDGTRVPMSVVHRDDVPLDGTAPALLYGYGSYEISIDPEFSIPRVSLLDRGFVFAIAHVRGGGEMGRAWYEDGKKLAKRHTFTDFIACARHLVAEGYTSPARLVAEGGSAGGMLMGAVANLAPEAFAGIVAAVPFVDPLTSMLMPELPLTATEWDEWGDPITDPAVYDYMAGYAPYENVTAQQYPKLLVTTGIHDTRVSYVEPTKWVAALRATATNAPEDILLRIEMEAGHGGVTGRYAAWRERARELAWVIRCVSDSGPSPS